VQLRRIFFTFSQLFLVDRLVSTCHCFRVFTEMPLNLLSIIFCRFHCCFGCNGFCSDVLLCGYWVRCVVCLPSVCL